MHILIQCVSFKKNLRESAMTHEALPVAVTAKKKPSSQSVPSAALTKKPDSAAPICSTRSVGSAANISPTKVPVPCNAIKTKPAKINDKETAPTDKPDKSDSVLFDLKRQEFLKFQKKFIEQQKEYMDRYAQLREMEARPGVPATSPIGEVRVLSLNDWPLHDLLLAMESAPAQQHTQIKGDLIRVSTILQHLTVQVSEIRKEVLAMGAELMRRRLELLKFIRTIQRNNNMVFVYEGHSIKWQTKNAEFDAETSRLQDLIMTTVQNLEVKLTQSLDAAKIPWKDRHNMLQKIEQLQRELSIFKKTNNSEDTSDKKKLLEELQRERAACVRLKEMLASAESRAEAESARVSDLERQLACCNTNRAKRPPKPQQYVRLVIFSDNRYLSKCEKVCSITCDETSELKYCNCRGASHDSYFKQAELTKEILSSQRDALELKVKELKEGAEEAIKRELQLSSRVEALLTKLENQEQRTQSAEKSVMESEKRFRDLQEQYNLLQERSRILLEAQNIKTLEYLPKKGLDILYDLVAAQKSLGRVKLQTRSRADKDWDRAESVMTEDFQSESPTPANLQSRGTNLEELMESNKTLKENLICCENQISALMQEVSALRNSNDYKSCDHEVPHEELKQQVLDLCLQVEQLTRERESLASEAMTRALLLERHEHCADLFARVLRAKHELAAQLAPDDNTSPSVSDIPINREMSNLMLKSHLSSASTWCALRAERARVLRLEGVVHAQAQQLDRESHMRMKQDRRRAQLERELLRTWASAASISPSAQTIKEADTITSDSLFSFKLSAEAKLDEKTQ